MNRALFAFAIVLSTAACGGSTAPASDAGTDATPGTDSATDAGGCIDVSQEGTPCTAGQKSCDRVDPCCASAFTCNAGAWKLEGLACLVCMSHPCGNKTCNGSQMCILHASGPECAPYPTACARRWTCGCVTSNPPAGCTIAANGCTDTNLPVTLSCSN